MSPVVIFLRLRPTVLSLLCMLMSAPCAAAAPELLTVEVESSAVGRTMLYNVLLPAGYRSSQERYPVLYLLHGFGGSYRTWAEENGAPFYAALHDDLILVMPDAGNTWYVNWASSEEGAPNAWEDYLVRDLITHVDRTFRTLARREGRAISGLSMGGFGALALGLRNPELFVSVGSSSGFLDYARIAGRRLKAPPVRSPRRRSRPEAVDAALGAWRDQPDSRIPVQGFSSQAERSPRGVVFAEAAQAADHDPFGLIERLPRERLPHVYLDCGTEDALSGVMHELAALLLEKEAALTVVQMAGGHDASYWTRALGHLVGTHREVMRRALGDRPESRLDEVPSATSIPRRTTELGGDHD